MDEPQPSPERKRLRLREFDYSTGGAYFVTICVHEHRMFREIRGEEMALNAAGEMIRDTWNELSQFLPGIESDEFIVMPNHVHGIVWLPPNDGLDEKIEMVRQRLGLPNVNENSNPIVGAGLRARPSSESTHANTNAGGHGNPPLRLFDVIERFKSITTTRYIKGVRERGWQPFHHHLWQRSFFDRIIRDETGLANARQYIMDNPRQWAFDRENPECMPQAKPTP